MLIATRALVTRGFVYGTIAMMLAAGLASAGPNALYYAGVDDSWGQTSEDDGVVARAPGTDLAGIANRVVLPGSVAGDGGRFLDARVAQRVGETNIYAAQLAAPVTDRTDIIFPGPVGAIAWYGQWLDRNDDGDIDDVHDDLGDADDEFVWRGESSGANVAMALFVYPKLNTSISFASGGTNAVRVYGLADRDDFFSGMHYKDFTDGEEQHYLEDGRATWAITPGMVDASLLTPMEHVTVADAIKVAGSRLGYDLSDPNALIDVDRYTTLNSDAESLYASVMTSLSPTYQAVRVLLVDTDDERRELAGNPLAPVAGITASTSRTTSPPDPREPNHPEDDYGGNALYGGVGDVAGSHNSYAGYQSDYHYFADAYARIMWHPTLNDNQGVQGVDLEFSQSPYPSVEERSHSRQPTAVFGIHGRFQAWWDTSGDGYLGTMCDPSDPQAWDAERNTCRGAEDGSGYIEGSGAGDKFTTLCHGAQKNAVVVTPIGGNWPGVVVIRDHERWLDSAVGGGIEVHTDSAPISLEWRPCIGTGTSRSRDIILFPGGSPTIPIETQFTSTSGPWIDGSGVLRASETVIDVDYYYPML